MSAFHHRAELASRDHAEAFYRYFPDTVINPNCAGTFKVSLATWEFEIVNSAEAEAIVGVTTDAQCVARLVQKLKSQISAGGTVPEALSWLA